MSKVARKSQLIESCVLVLSPASVQGRGFLSRLGRVIDQNTGTTGRNSNKKDLLSIEKTTAIGRLSEQTSPAYELARILFMGKFG